MDEKLTGYLILRFEYKNENKTMRVYPQRDCNACGRVNVRVVFFYCPAPDA